MTVTPRTLADLGAYWTAMGGRNLGVIGNAKHCAGYHLGKDRIFSDCACKPDGTCVPGRRWDDYSVKTTRDRNGLTNAASAIDLGRLDGSLQRLFDFSSWLARRCLENAPGTADVREVIYSPDGQRVLGFKDGIAFLIPGYGDLSHLTHTHISFYRDSELRDKRPLFMPYFELPDTGAIMESFTYDRNATTGLLSVKTDRPDYMYLRLFDASLHPAGAVQGKHAFGPVRLLSNRLGSTDARKVGYLIGDEAAFMLATDVVFRPNHLHRRADD